MRSPLAQNIQFTPLDPRAVKVEIFVGIIITAIAAAIGIVIAALTVGGWVWLLPVAAVLLCVWLTWIGMRQMRAYGYAELADELLIRNGIMFHKVRVVPYGRMQQVNVETGPVLRRYGLAEVHLITASSATNARIPGLALPEAERLREKLTALGNAQMEGL